VVAQTGPARLLDLVEGRSTAAFAPRRGFRNLINYRLRALLHCGHLAL
jgi:hypothetical protein